jgi:hypothetical protein
MSNTTGLHGIILSWAGCASRRFARKGDLSSLHLTPAISQMPLPKVQLKPAHQPENDRRESGWRLQGAGLKTTPNLSQ